MIKCLKLFPFILLYFITNKNIKFLLNYNRCLIYTTIGKLKSKNLAFILTAALPFLSYFNYLFFLILYLNLFLAFSYLKFLFSELILLNLLKIIPTSRCNMILRSVRIFFSLFAFLKTTLCVFILLL